MTVPASRPRWRPGEERGQAAVELVALLPVACLVGLVLLCVLAAAGARGQADAAAQAGAMALLQAGDARAAARAALAPGARRRARIEVRGRAVRVVVRPGLPLPGLAWRLRAVAVASAGPEAAP